MLCFVLGNTGESSTLRQLMNIPNEPDLSPNDGLGNVSLSDQSMPSKASNGQANCPDAQMSSRDGSSGHVIWRGGSMERDFC